MLKRQITYTDFNDQEVTEVFYFNISKPELIELEVEYGGGFTQTIQSIIDAEDAKRLVEEFKRIVLLAYGEKSEDGKRFVKNDKLREDFASHAAYIQLYMELATDSDKASEFVNGIMPADLIDGKDQDKPAIQTSTVEEVKDANGLSG